MDEVKVKNLVEVACNAERYSEVAPKVEQAMTSFARSVVADTMKKNVELHYKLGLSPKIVRKLGRGSSKKRSTSGADCEFCTERVGTFPYNKDNINKGIFSRHAHCTCTLEYFPGNGKKQNSWSKRWEKVGEDDKIEERKLISEAKTENAMFPKELAGAKRGNLMTFEEADSNRPNPKFRDDYMYRINCQTCVVAYEARRRGYDVEAKGNFSGSISQMLSRATNKAWIDPNTGKYPEYIAPEYFSNINTPSRYMKYLEETLKENTRYTMQFGWKGRGNSGHIIHVFKKNGVVTLYDPQIGQTTNKVKEYLEDVKMTTTSRGIKYTIAPRLLEVQNYEFNIEVVNQILKKAGE